MNLNIINKLSLLTNELEKFGKLSIVDNENYFFDEPNLYTYSLVLEPHFKYKNKEFTHFPIGNITATGQSFFDKELALLKGVSECIERTCLYIFPRNVITGKYKEVGQSVLEPEIYGIDHAKQSFDWVQGENLTSEKKCLIPAQLIYLGYGINTETRLTCQNSTGAACANTRDAAILRGIYEVIERDAFMCVYLNRITVPKIEITSITDDDVLSILQLLSQYNLTLELFNITNDFNIPTILSVIFDNSFFGPNVTVGIKTDRSIKRAIIGSIEEAVVRRVTIRGMMQRNELKEKVYKVENIVERASYWFLPGMVKHLNFLYDSNKIEPFNGDLSNTQTEDDLDEIITKMKRLGFSIYTTCISDGKISSKDCVVYKTIIPGLQPLFQSERERIVNKKRIKDVSLFFKKRTLKINTIPHPFI